MGRGVLGALPPANARCAHRCSDIRGVRPAGREAAAEATCGGWDARQLAVDRQHPQPVSGRPAFQPCRAASQVPTPANPRACRAGLHFCGGSLVKEQWVISTQQCFSSW